MTKAMELVASYWTIAGDVWIGGPTEVSHWDFRTRVEAARIAGYKGIGIIHADLNAASAAIGFPEMKRILDDNGMKYLELEIITDWYAEGDRKEQSDRIRFDLLRAAEQLGARHIKICGDIHAGQWPLDRLVKGFALLCQDAANAGTRIALEPMPFSNIKTLEHALAIIKGAGATNGGLLLDIWHISRGNIPYEALRQLPPESVTWVEIDDADAKPTGTLWEDTLFHRKLCGEGALDVPRFLGAIEALGYDGPFGVEIISETHRRLPLADAATRSFNTAARQFVVNQSARQ